MFSSPMAQLEIVAAEAAGELGGPGLREIRPAHRLPVRDGPGRENSEHDRESQRGVPDVQSFRSSPSR